MQFLDKTAGFYFWVTQVVHNVWCTNYVFTALLFETGILVCHWFDWLSKIKQFVVKRKLLGSTVNLLKHNE